MVPTLVEYFQYVPVYDLLKNRMIDLGLVSRKNHFLLCNLRSIYKIGRVKMCHGHSIPLIFIEQLHRLISFHIFAEQIENS